MQPNQLNRSFVSMAYDVSKIASNPVGCVRAVILHQLPLVADITFSFIVLSLSYSVFSYCRSVVFSQYLCLNDEILLASLYSSSSYAWIWNVPVMLLIRFEKSRPIAVFMRSLKVSTTGLESNSTPVTLSSRWSYKVVVVFIDTGRSVLTHESYKTYNTHTHTHVKTSNWTMKIISTIKL